MCCSALNDGGIYLDYSTGINIMNVSVAHNKYVGISLDYSTNTK